MSADNDTSPDNGQGILTGSIRTSNAVCESLSRNEIEFSSCSLSKHKEQVLAEDSLILP